MLILILVGTLVQEAYELGYWLSHGAWRGLFYAWHALPAVGHGLLRVVTMGLK